MEKINVVCEFRSVLPEDLHEVLTTMSEAPKFYFIEDSYGKKLLVLADGKHWILDGKFEIVDWRLSHK